jgi:hypothetical protein
MALLGLLLLPSNYRAGAENAHAHSLIQLWADATNGTIRHHLDHGVSHPGQERPSSWFDPAIDDTDTTASVGFHDERPDATAQQESAPMSSGVHLLLTVMTTIVAPGLCQVPAEVPGQRHTELSPRVHVPPPRWTAAAK